MPSKHYYTHSSGYCFGPNNQNGVFGPSNNDPKNLRKHLDIALSGKALAWHANGNEDINCEPDPEETCDISNLPDIVTVFMPDTIVEGNCISKFTVFYQDIFNCRFAPYTTIQEKFLCVLNIVSNLALIYAFSGTQNPCDPVTDPFEIVAIFDDKLVIQWGKLIDDGSMNLIRQSHPLPFPLLFSKFTISMHSLTTDIYYVHPFGIFT